MARIRLDDDYIYHPKFKALTANAFRLWHEGMSYSRKVLTDGLIPREALKTFLYAKPASIKELTTSVGNLAPLWEPHDVGFKVHDYLDWNAGYEEENLERDAAKLRMRAFRGRRKSDGRNVTRNVTPDVTPLVTPDVTPPVLGKGKGEDLPLRSSERESERKPSTTTQSRWPIYKGNRLVVFDWMLTKMQGTLGPFAELVEWDIWLDAADQRAMREPVVAADWWPWLQSELLIHAREQGWTVAVDGATVGKQTSKLMAAVANIAREAQS